MRFLLEILFNQAWILFMTATFINGFILKSRSKKYIANNPELENGYSKLFKAWIFYGNLPWLIMAIGNLSRLTRSTLDYFAPRQMNAVVLVFHAAIIVLWILSVRWIYFQNGAEFLAEHPGLLKTNQTAGRLKLIFPLLLAGGILTMVMMWLKNPAIPRF